MAATRLADPRGLDAMTAEQADALFAELAQADIRVKKAQAAAEKRIADIKERCAQETAADQEAVAALAERLSAYILAHRDRFLKPRQRKTEYGKYGLRTSTRTDILDEDALRAISDERGLGLYRVEAKIDKKAVEKALADGEDLGDAARVVSGDVASYDVSRDLLKV